MPVADTSFIVDLLRRDPAAVLLFEKFEEKEQGLCTTGITALELYKGAYCSADKESPDKVKKILALFTIIPINERVYEIYGKLSAGLHLKGKPLGPFDEVIAAIALLTDQKIITRDRHFSVVPGLFVIDY